MSRQSDIEAMLRAVAYTLPEYKDLALSIGPMRHFAADDNSDSWSILIQGPGADTQPLQNLASQFASLLRSSNEEAVRDALEKARIRVTTGGTL